MRQGNLYTIMFIIIVSLAAAMILSVSSTLLKERQERNVEVDIKRNILLAAGAMKPGDDVEKLYSMNIKGIVVNSRGEITSSSISAEKIDFEGELEKNPDDRRYPVFISASGGRVKSYCIPIVGKGLWSTLYGYLALEADLNTVKGITFYKHGETPGLGGEIESASFRSNFTGKRILAADGTLMSLTVLKGKTAANSQGIIHQVDGISGATLTTAGVNKLLKNCLLIYEPYFRNVRAGKR